MNRRALLYTALAVLLLTAAAFAAKRALADDEKAEPKPQTTCPVMGGKINKELFVDHDGKRIYLCCPGCEAAVKKDPAKYIAKLEDDGITLDKPIKPQNTCPVMGGKINKELFVDHAGKRIYLCCPGCEAAVKKDPAKYIAKLEDDGITLDKPIKPQTTCPVMGGKINKEVFADHAGKRVYFCRPGCLGAFQKDPAKYIAKLEEAGITLEEVIKPVENPEAALQEVQETEKDDDDAGAARGACGGCGGCGMK